MEMAVENHESKFLKVFIAVLTLCLLIPQLGSACETAQLNGSLIELEKYKMEKFDKELFEQKRKKGEYDYSYILNNGVTVRQSESESYYFESRSQGTLEKTRTFYKSTLTLKTEATTIQGVLIDSARVYDESGKLTEETLGLLTNEQVNRLVRKVKTEFNVDLTIKGYSVLLPQSYNGKTVLMVWHNMGQQLNSDSLKDEQFVLINIPTLNSIVSGVVKHKVDNPFFSRPVYFIDDKEVEFK